jgi:hypothetical protein
MCELTATLGRLLENGGTEFPWVLGTNGVDCGRSDERSEKDHMISGLEVGPP